MIASMTGFGRGEAEHEGFIAMVELRSVNNRYCEVSARLPRFLAERDSDVQKILKSIFSRGRINVQIKIELPVAEGSDLKLDEAAVRAYLKLLEDLRTTTGIDEPIRLDHILKNPDLFKAADEDNEAAGKAWKAVEDALRAAAKDMREMRFQEGKALEAELIERVDAIATCLAEIEEEAPKRIPSAGEKLRGRLAEIVEDDRIDNDRLEFELALLADKLDVREECVRLHSHLNLFREALASDKPVGRKLNFLSQEMNREINTIGSKANDAGLSHLVVDMKEDLEKIREQVENIE